MKVAAVACGGGAARQRLTHTDGTQALFCALGSRGSANREARRRSGVETAVVRKSKARGEDFAQQFQIVERTRQGWGGGAALAWKNWLNRGGDNLLLLLT